MRVRDARLVMPLLGSVLATACAHGGDTGREAAAQPSRPPVLEQSMALRQPESPYRTVVNGDTLYSIAWEVGRDYREIAAWNRIRPPYTIKPGQQLRVLPPPSTGPSRASATAGVPKEADRRAATAAKKPARTSTVAAKPAVGPAPKPVSPTATAKSPKSGSKTGSGSKTSDGRTKPETVGRSEGRGSGSWVWPADGQVVTRYAEADSKGVDIAGSRGAPIRAAASGRVVYQGSGLRGYGQLIIIKHSDEFLSAYAHNDRIYVKEGDAVKRGQKIADMGSSGTDRVKLHFEVRRRGVPTDPLQYLPKR